MGNATVTGVDSTWTNSLQFYVGNYGHGSLSVEAGGQVSTSFGYLGFNSGSVGTAAVTGAGSKWVNHYALVIGYRGSAELTINNGGLVSVVEILAIDDDINNDSFINMATGGMLALKGNVADSLSQFLGWVTGTDAIRFWDDSLADWSLLTNATYGVDYTLEYLISGDLAGYTLLTVGTAVPEPGTIGLLFAGVLALLRRSGSDSEPVGHFIK